MKLILSVEKLNKRKINRNVKDIISVISGAIGTSLGFVVGYYFKSSENHNKN